MSEAAYTVIPFKGLRSIIARRMQESASQKPHVTLNTTAWADQMLGVQAAKSERLGVRLTATALLLKLTASALSEYPRINGRVEGGEIRLYREINIGVAVALEDALTVPVIRQVDAKPLAEVARELADLAGRARHGKLRPQELMDATFTVSNLGGFGVTHFTPIINPPEIAVLGVGRTETATRWTDGQPQPAALLNLSLSFDHAAIDGAQAATFLQKVVERVENPGLGLSGTADGGGSA